MPMSTASASFCRGSRMDADLLTEPDDKIELKGSGIIAAIKASGIEFILSVPDIVTSGGLLRPIARHPEDPRDERVFQPKTPVDEFVLKFQKPN